MRYDSYIKPENGLTSIDRELHRVRVRRPYLQGTYRDFVCVRPDSPVYNKFDAQTRRF